MLYTCKQFAKYKEILIDNIYYNLVTLLRTLTSFWYSKHLLLSYLTRYKYMMSIERVTAKAILYQESSKINSSEHSADLI